MANSEGQDEDQPSILEDGKLFLFQLPPLTPFLTDPTSLPTLKTEPSTTSTTIDLDTLPDVPSTSTTTIKPDPDPSSTQTPQKLQVEGTLTASEPQRLPAGLVGKLNIHRSGKVTLDWGGTDMEVRLGSEVDFLQDVVLVKPPGTKGEDGEAGEDEEMMDFLGGKKDEKKGKAFALGQVRKKMVLIPDWAKLYD